MASIDAQPGPSGGPSPSSELFRTDLSEEEQMELAIQESVRAGEEEAERRAEETRMEEEAATARRFEQIQALRRDEQAAAAAAVALAAVALAAVALEHEAMALPDDLAAQLLLPPPAPAPSPHEPRDLPPESATGPRPVPVAALTAELPE